MKSQGINDKDYESFYGSDNNLNEKKIEKKVKNYAMKYNVIQIKCQDTGDQDPSQNFSTQFGDIDLKQFVLISLKKDIYDQFCNSDQVLEKEELNTIFKNIHQQKKIKNYLIELLSKKQNFISYQTTQEMHLLNSYTQLIGGEQQYQNMLNQLNQE